MKRLQSWQLYEVNFHKTRRATDNEAVIWWERRAQIVICDSDMIYSTIESYSHIHSQRYQVLVETKNSFFRRSFAWYLEVDHSRENLDWSDSHLWRVAQYRSKCKKEVVDDTLRQLESMRAARFFENFEDSQPIVDITSNRRLSLLIH